MSQAADLYLLLSKARLECYEEKLENKLKLNSVLQLKQLHAYSELTQIGMKKEEIERLRKVLKGNTMSKLKKLKALHSRSLDSDDPLTTKIASRSFRNAALTGKEILWACELMQSVKWEDCPLSKAAKSEFNPHAVRDLRRRVGAPQRLVQRSISTSADQDQSVLLDRRRRSSSLIRNSYSETSDKLLKNQERRDVAEQNCLVDDILNIMRGPPYDQEVCTASDDTSPLIQSDVEPYRGARHSFDNLASVESSMSGVTEYHPVAVTTANNELNNEQIHSVSSKQAKRQKPELKISIPGLDNGSSHCNLKPMSAVAERQINEAIELANSLARLSTDDRSRHGLRTPGSFSDGCCSPGSHFFFNFRKSRAAKEEKKTFLDGLNSQTNEPDQVMTPGALEAYDALVTRTQLSEAETRDTGDSENSCVNRRSWESSEDSDSSSPEQNRVPLPLPKGLDRKREQDCPSDSVLKQSNAKISSTVFPSQMCPSNAHKPKDLSCLNRSLSLGNPERLGCEADHVDFLLCHSLVPEKLQELDDDMLPPTYPAPSPPSALKTLQPEPTRELSELEKAPEEITFQSSPPPLPAKMSRQDCESLSIEDSPPSYQAPCPPPPPAVPPPALPPRIPLRPSTVNSKPYERRFPLSSEIPSSRLHLEAADRSNKCVSCGGRNEREKSFKKQSFSMEHDCRLQVKEARLKGLCNSVESSCESDVGNITHGSEDSVFSDSVPCRSDKPRAMACSASLAAVNSGVVTHVDQPLKLNIKQVKLNAAELGIYDKADLFWVKSVNFDFPEKSQSESNLLQNVSAPIPGRYETSDCVSYEDLMEFALDGPLKTSSSNSLMCDEVRILMKMFSNDVTVEDCMDALTETFWDVHSAVKLIKLKQVMSTGLADKQQCKQALLFCRWNVNDAALYLLTPPQQRVTPDLLDV